MASWGRRSCSCSPGRRFGGRQHRRLVRSGEWLVGWRIRFEAERRGTNALVTAIVSHCQVVRRIPYFGGGTGFWGCWLGAFQRAAKQEIARSLRCDGDVFKEVAQSQTAARRCRNPLLKSLKSLMDWRVVLSHSCWLNGLQSCSARNVGVSS